MSDIKIMVLEYYTCYTHSRYHTTGVYAISKASFHANLASFYHIFQP